MINHKWCVIQPLRTRWKCPDSKSLWSNNSFANISRLLRADAYHIDDNDIPLDADIYFLSSFDIALIKKEIDFIKKVKSLGKKVVMAFSQDLRFLFGSGLMYDGVLYTDLMKECDLVLSGISNELDMFGRQQYKVIPFGLPFERLNFSNKKYEDREIDILVSSSIGEECFPVTIEILYLLKEKFPDKKIVYSIDTGHIDKYKYYINDFTFVPGGLINYLPNAKVYFSPEIRPRPGRALIESFYCRTPFIACSWVYHANLFKEFNYNCLSMSKIIDCYSRLLDSNYIEIIKKAEEIAEYDYFDNFYSRMISRLFS